MPGKIILDLSEFEVSLVYIVSSKDSQGYVARPCLKNKNKNAIFLFFENFIHAFNVV